MKVKQSILAITLLTTASSAALAAAPAYKLKDLGVAHQGDRSAAYSISNTSLITGYARMRVPTGPGEDMRTSTQAARFYHETDYVDVIGGMGYDGGHGSTIGRAINDSGLVAGYGPIPGTPRKYQAFVHHYKTGFMENIGTLGDGPESRAYGINNNGKVVGWSNTQADGSDNVAFVYDSSTRTMEQLQGPLLGGSRSFAFDINDSDVIVGTATTPDGSAHAFKYHNGMAMDLGSLDNSGYAEARAINESGMVTGFSLDANNNYTAFIFDDTNGMQSLQGLGGDSFGYDINEAGQVVGNATDANGDRTAFLYSDGQMYDLYDLLSASDQALIKSISAAYGINDDGTVVGLANFWTDKDAGRSARRAFMLTAVPLPGAVFFMAPALGLLGLIGKKRTQASA